MASEVLSGMAARREGREIRPAEGRSKAVALQVMNTYLGPAAGP